MSTSLLYHVFGVRTYHYLRTEYHGGEVFLHVEKKPSKQRCKACGSRRFIWQGRITRSLRTVPIGSHPVHLVLHLHRLECSDCSALLQEKLDVADPRKTYTRAFARLVVELSRYMTISALAQYLRVGWDLIKSILTNHLQRRFKTEQRRRLRRLKYIGIDEFAVRKGHKYMTVVVDLQTGHVVFVADGRDHKCLKPFFEMLARLKVQLSAISIDMSPAYIKAVELYTEDVPIIHDRFHIVAMMNDVVDELRRKERKHYPKEQYKRLKDGRYLLKTNPENLDDDETERLNGLLEEFPVMALVYRCKEQLRSFYHQSSVTEAAKVFDQWLVEVARIGLKPLKTLARTLKGRRQQMEGWYAHPISNGRVEGLNNKIKMFKRSIFSFRDRDFFKLRLFFLDGLGVRSAHM